MLRRRCSADPSSEGAEVAAVGEDDVAEDQQGPPIAQHLDGGADRVVGVWFHDPSLTASSPSRIVVAERNHYSEGDLMGRFVYGMNVSLDLRIEQVPGDDGAGEWLSIDEELHRAWGEQVEALALLVQGQVIHELMEDAWPHAGEDASLPDYMREYGAIWTAKPKVLVSRTRTSADYNTRIIGGDDAIEQLAVLRAQTDGDIAVGGANLATQVLRAGLLDEIVLAIHPRSSASAVHCSTTTTGRSTSSCSSSGRSRRASRCTATRSSRREARALMLTQVADGVFVHQSELLQNNTAVVQGRGGGAADRPRDHEQRADRSRGRPSGVGAARGRRLRHASRLGSRALARRTRRRAAVRYGGLCEAALREAPVEGGLEGPASRR